MTDNVNVNFYEMKQRVDFIWMDVYGDDSRRERGILGEIKDVALAVNRLSVVLVFFALISLLNLAAFVWVVLSL